MDPSTAVSTATVASSPPPPSSALQVMSGEGGGHSQPSAGAEAGEASSSSPTLSRGSSKPQSSSGGAGVIHGRRSDPDPEPAAEAPPATPPQVSREEPDTTAIRTSNNDSVDTATVPPAAVPVVSGSSTSNNNNVISSSAGGVDDAGSKGRAAAHPVRKTCPVLLCDGCRQPLSIYDGILGYDENVKESSHEAFRYKLQGLFNVDGNGEPTGESRRASRQAARGEEEDEDEEEEGVCAYSAVNPNQQRFDLLRITPLLTLPPQVVAYDEEKERKKKLVQLQLSPTSKLLSSGYIASPSGTTSPTAVKRKNTTSSPRGSVELGAMVSRNPTLNEEAASASTSDPPPPLYPPVSPFNFRGPYSPEHSFFVGYQWQCCECGMCGKFLGWGFAKAPKNNSNEEEEERRGVHDDDEDCIVPSDTPPEFIGIILRSCTGQDDFPVSKLRTLLKSHSRRKAQSDALHRFTEKWMPLLQARPTDLLVHALLRAFQQRRQEFLRVISENGGEEVWLGEHRYPPSHRLGDEPGYQQPQQAGGPEEPQPQPQIRSSLPITLSTSSSSPPPRHSTVLNVSGEEGLGENNSVSPMPRHPLLPPSRLLLSTATNTGTAGTGTVTVTAEPSLASAAAERASLPVPFYPSALAEEELDDDWRDILSFLPTSFAGLLTVARSLAVIQDPVIGVRTARRRRRLLRRSRHHHRVEEENEDNGESRGSSSHRQHRLSSAQRRQRRRGRHWQSAASSTSSTSSADGNNSSATSSSYRPHGSSTSRGEGEAYNDEEEGRLMAGNVMRRRQFGGVQRRHTRDTIIESHTEDEHGPHPSNSATMIESANNNTNNSSSRMVEVVQVMEEEEDGTLRTINLDEAAGEIIVVEEEEVSAVTRLLRAIDERSNGQQGGRDEEEDEYYEEDRRYRPPQRSDADDDEGAGEEQAAEVYLFERRPSVEDENGFLFTTAEEARDGVLVELTEVPDRRREDAFSSTTSSDVEDTASAPPHSRPRRGGGRRSGRTGRRGRGRGGIRVFFMDEDEDEEEEE